MKFHNLLLSAATILLLTGGRAAAVPVLFERIYEVDGVSIQPNAGDAIPGFIHEGVFDLSTGLGTSTVTVSGAGSHYVGLFLDHEIDEFINTYFNELGSSSGVPLAGQTYEIDEPGYVFGDIFDNLLNEALDGTILAGPEDISMALAHEFVLSDGETATVSFVAGEVAPAGFFLRHSDPDSGVAVYFSSTLDIRAGGTAVPDTTDGRLALLALGVTAWMTRAARARPSSSAWAASRSD